MFCHCKEFSHQQILFQRKAFPWDHFSLRFPGPWLFSFNFEFQIKICDENQALVPIPAFDGLVAIWRVFSATFEVSVTSSLIHTLINSYVVLRCYEDEVRLSTDSDLIWSDCLHRCFGGFSDSAIWLNFSSVFIGKSRHEGSSRLWMKWLFHGKKLLKWI